MMVARSGGRMNGTGEHDDESRFRNAMNSAGACFFLA